MIHNKKTLKAQSAMEYLMTYGWAILIIAVVLAALFELGVFGTGGTPQACIAQAGFICASPVFSATSGGSNITFQFGQNTGQTFYSVNVFVAQEGETLTSGSANVIGVPLNMTGGGSTDVSGNTVPIGTLQSGQIYTVTFGNTPTMTEAGGMPIDPVIGTPFYGYIWVSYCTTGPCAQPTNFAKVGTLAIKSTH